MSEGGRAMVSSANGLWDFGNRCLADAATSESTINNNIETNVCILGPTRIGQVSFAERQPCWHRPVSNLP